MEEAVAALSRLHQSWISRAGGVFRQAVNGITTCEVSPLVSYCGEGLDGQFLNGMLDLPLHLDSNHEARSTDAAVAENCSEGEELPPTPRSGGASDATLSPHARAFMPSQTNDEPPRQVAPAVSSSNAVAPVAEAQPSSTAPMPAQPNGRSVKQATGGSGDQSKIAPRQPQSLAASEAVGSIRPKGLSKGPPGAGVLPFLEQETPLPSPEKPRAFAPAADPRLGSRAIGSPSDGAGRRAWAPGGATSAGQRRQPRDSADVHSDGGSSATSSHRGSASARRRAWAPGEGGKQQRSDRTDDSDARTARSDGGLSVSSTSSRRAWAPA
mmetsp:Transcript_11899/g.42568  ORF Transcript_11899/g.42568 Transcript_11899/m.42568 type:complete len:325 (+) Transcript_11899:79-1053(+)